MRPSTLAFGNIRDIFVEAGHGCYLRAATNFHLEGKLERENTKAGMNVSKRGDLSGRPLRGWIPSAAEMTRICYRYLLLIYDSVGCRIVSCASFSASTYRTRWQ